ncbi:ATP synthase subunit I [Nocardia gipuzkoensis]
MRRVAVIVAALGVLALMITGALDRVLLGVFVCAGLGLGWLNAQLTWKSVTHVIRSDTASKQGLVLSTAVRLLATTVLAILVAFLARPNGIGIFFGLAVFQIVVVLHTVVPEWKGLRQLP